MDLDYTILNSGSDGNAVRIGELMIDCGIPFSRMRKELLKCKYLFITHKHTDHLNKTTFKKIRAVFPKIIIIANWQVAMEVDVDIICNEGYPVDLELYTLVPFKVEHDVLCYGLYFLCNGYDVLYSTDLASTDTLPDLKFDYIFLESNYRDDLIKQVINERHGRYMPYLNTTTRHLSSNDSLAYYIMHRKSKESKYIELHKSKRFNP